MLAAPEGEQHVVALRMTGSLLRDAGYDVVMLGADVPADALAAVREPPRAGRRLPERDDAGRRGPGADRDPRGAAAVAVRGLRDRRPRAHLRVRSRARGSRSAGASPRWSRRSTRWSSART